MRRSLPTFLCVALGTGLSACDEPVDGPTTDDELALYDFRGAATPAIPNYPGNGDLTVTRANANAGGGGGGGGGGINFDFDIINNAVARAADGAFVVEVDGNDILSPAGEVLCSIRRNGLFRTLSAADDSVLYSSLGPWVFDGSVELGGLSPFQAYQQLNAQLLVSFDETLVVDDLPSSGEPVAVSNVELELASGPRKLLITAMLDGACGGEVVTFDGL